MGDVHGSSYERFEATAGPHYKRRGVVEPTNGPGRVHPRALWKVFPMIAKRGVLQHEVRDSMPD